MRAVSSFLPLLLAVVLGVVAKDMVRTPNLEHSSAADVALLTHVAHDTKLTLADLIPSTNFYEASVNPTGIGTMPSASNTNPTGTRDGRLLPVVGLVGLGSLVAGFIMRR